MLAFADRDPVASRASMCRPRWSARAEELEIQSGESVSRSHRQRISHALLPHGARVRGGDRSGSRGRGEGKLGRAGAGQLGAGRDGARGGEVPPTTDRLTGSTPSCLTLRGAIESGGPCCRGRRGAGDGGATRALVGPRRAVDPHALRDVLGAADERADRGAVRVLIPQLSAVELAAGAPTGPRAPVVVDVREPGSSSCAGLTARVDSARPNRDAQRRAAARASARPGLPSRRAQPACGDAARRSRFHAGAQPRRRRGSVGARRRFRDEAILTRSRKR